MVVFGDDESKLCEAISLDFIAISASLNEQRNVELSYTVSHFLCRFIVMLNEALTLKGILGHYIRCH